MAKQNFASQSGAEKVIPSKILRCFQKGPSNWEPSNDCAAILAKEGEGLKRFGKDEDIVRSTKLPSLSEKLLTLPR
jgi:hypothetical protein